MSMATKLMDREEALVSNAVMGYAVSCWLLKSSPFWILMGQRLLFPGESLCKPDKL